MRVVRGHVHDVERDRAVTRRLVDHVEESGEPAVRAWAPPRQVAFGRRDATADGYDRAREAALEHGFEPVERSVGGHAVAYTGDTVAFVYAVPVADGDARVGIQSRYDDALNRLQGAFEAMGVPVRQGEPDDAFCPGDHSLQRDGKIVGLAQRVTGGSAVVGGCVVVSEADETGLARVLEPVYDALEVPFDPASVGSVEGAGGPGDPGVVADALGGAFAGEEAVEHLDATALLD